MPLINPDPFAHTSTAGHLKNVTRSSKNEIVNGEANALRDRMQQLQPWRMSVQLTDQIGTGGYLDRFEPSAAIKNQARSHFLNLVDKLFPSGLLNKRLLDCGCNAGGYCFWARERKVEIGYGFDVREHWIKQARFIKHKRTVSETDRLQFEVFSIYDLPSRDLDPFDIVLFKGLFVHLSDPINGLKLAADLSRDVLIFSSTFVWGATDGALKSESGKPNTLHGSVEDLNWIPTGPGVCAELIRTLGFDELKLTKLKQVRSHPNRGRLEIVAAREKNRLGNLPGEEI